MKIVVLEGKHDGIFLQSMLENNLGISTHLIIEKGKHIKKISKKGINELIRILTDKKKYTTYLEKFKFIIYGDNGKQTVISKVLPRLCKDLLGKSHSRQTSIIAILDEDSSSLESILKKIKEKIVNISFNSRILDIDKDCFKIQPINDSRYWVSVKMHLIPKSLEYQIVHAITDKTKEINKKRKKQILKMDPHEALNEIARILNTTKEDIIKQSVVNGWIQDNLWYNELINNIQEFFKGC